MGWWQLTSAAVRDYLPLQQGLRRCGFASNRVRTSLVRDYLPLQQGLRPFIIRYYLS